LEEIDVLRPTVAQRIKRLGDMIGAIVLCVLLAPVMLAVAVAIRWETPGPVFFRQERRGLGFRLFTIWKFRSMTANVPDPHANYETVASDPRITRVGAFIRRTSLDELPQLFNVIGGSMSLVGPRPLVEWESREAARTHPARFLMPPGITGLSQVEVRNAADFVTRVEQDVLYVERWSLWLDFVILLRTPACVLCKEMIYPDSKSPT
jgi:putative colanic acid biosynthesis UDP-glucose lipid carrier transferase